MTEILDLRTIIMLLSFAIGGGGAVWRVSNLLREFEKKLERKINVVEDDANQKRARIYERFDQYKKHLETEFVRVPMCLKTHEIERLQLDKVDKVNSDFRHDMRNEMAKVCVQYEDTRQTISAIEKNIIKIMAKMGIQNGT